MGKVNGGKASSDKARDSSMVEWRVWNDKYRPLAMEIGCSGMYECRDMAGVVVIDVAVSECSVHFVGRRESI